MESRKDMPILLFFSPVQFGSHKPNDVIIKVFQASQDAHR